MIFEVSSPGREAEKDERSGYYWVCFAREFD